MAKDETRSDAVEALLRADEEELRAKRTRLRTFARNVEVAREAIATAQAAAAEIRTHDGVSRADLAQTFELTQAERSLLTPARGRSRLAQSEDGAVGALDGSNAEPESRLDQPAGKTDGSGDSESAKADDQVQHEAN